MGGGYEKDTKIKAIVDPQNGTYSDTNYQIHELHPLRTHSDEFAEKQWPGKPGAGVWVYLYKLSRSTEKGKLKQVKGWYRATNAEGVVEKVTEKKINKIKEKIEWLR